MARGHRPTKGPPNAEKTKPPDSGSGVRPPPYPLAEEFLFRAGIPTDEIGRQMALAMGDFERALRGVARVANMSADKIRELEKQAREAGEE